MKSLSTIALGAVIGAAALGATASSASAAIVCNGTICWHTHQTYHYPAVARVIVHPDTWRWGPSDHYAWREHAGRGYWRGNRWTVF